MNQLVTGQIRSNASSAIVSLDELRQIVGEKCRNKLGLRGVAPVSRYSNFVILLPIPTHDPLIWPIV